MYSIKRMLDKTLCALRDEPDRGLGHSKRHQEDGQAHRAADAGGGELGAARRVRPVLHGHRPGRLQEPQGRRQADRHRARTPSRASRPGQRSVHLRNPNYWRTGQPYFDKVTVIDIPDDSARVNALLGGQVDAIDAIPFPQIPSTQGKGFKMLNSAGRRLDADQDAGRPGAVQRRPRAAGDAADRRPAADGRGAFSGYGRVGKDLYSPFDAAYAPSLPQRVQDIDKAKSLLEGGGPGAT